MMDGMVYLSHVWITTMESKVYHKIQHHLSENMHLHKKSTTLAFVETAEKASPSIELLMWRFDAFLFLHMATVYENS